jgi:hypothetical protein
MEEVYIYLIITKLILSLQILNLTELYNQEVGLLYNNTIIFHLNNAILVEMKLVIQMEEVSLYLIIIKLI